MLRQLSLYLFLWITCIFFSSFFLNWFKKIFDFFYFSFILLLILQDPLPSDQILPLARWKICSWENFSKVTFQEPLILLPNQPVSKDHPFLSPLSWELISKMVIQEFHRHSHWIGFFFLSSIPLFMELAHPFFFWGGGGMSCVIDCFPFLCLLDNHILRSLT